MGLFQTNSNMPKQETSANGGIKYEIPFKILNIPFDSKPADPKYRLLANNAAALKEEKLGINDIKQGRLLPIHSKRRDPKLEKYKSFEELKENNFTKEQRDFLAKKKKISKKRNPIFWGKKKKKKKKK